MPALAGVTSPDIDNILLKPLGGHQGLTCKSLPVCFVVLVEGVGPGAPPKTHLPSLDFPLQSNRVL